MNINFKKNINHTFMIIEKVKEFKENNFKVQMMLNNRINGLLKFDYEEINGEINFLYDISSKQVFFRKFENQKMSFDNIQVLLFSLKAMIYALDEYLLNPDDVILKKECIFIDQSGNNYEFCYYPYYNGNIVLELQELFGNILQIVDYEEDRAVRLAYELYETTQSENFTMGDLMEVLSRENCTGFIPANQIEETAYEDHTNLPIMLEKTDNNVYRGEVEEKPFFTKLSRYLKGRGFMDVLEDINNGEFMDRVQEYGFGGEEEFNYRNIMNNYAVESLKEETDYDLGFEFYDYGKTEPPKR